MSAVERESDSGTGKRFISLDSDFQGWRFGCRRVMDEVIPPGKAYFRISEVSRILGVAPYVIRFWESEFQSVQPARTQSGQRLYRRKDLQELLTIKNLLYEELYTLKGARRQLLLRNASASADFRQGTRRKLEAVKEGLLQIRELLKAGGNKAV